ncbi:DUF371 domain-containing protein [Halorubrum lacusprofundi]|jgi:hypothetical protein|uniref:DUF371 domain-containing protein n=1 Tax=Halorubrum lacusprofundi (strain ATCC 49239 / DSM 5036 / JCM 8891 / ACAM 34) TaxID=416348 RepID=B9LUQ4_HALLT|nr:DUF371 domain-containing protein [Halorubrum lacusprofundi]ACM56381.1 Protein of unknown function DUF371 [Halorubrum lacusprofundi ATCC 49239]MCG1005347.1 DUF371 domain-containing protein [Halorubrum lacusprofundi]
MSDAESDVGDVVDDPLVEVVRAVGHENITAEHASTVELTTDDWLTPAGDCIVGVEADRTPRDFSTSFREACQEADATITATFAVGEPGDEAVDVDDPAYVAEIAGRGDPDLTLLDDRSMVGRTSDYTDDERTIFVDGDGAAADLDRDLVAALAADAPVTLRLEVDPAE